MKVWGFALLFLSHFLKYLIKMECCVIWLFYFHRISKNGGGGRGSSEPLEPL